MSRTVYVEHYDDTRFPPETYGDYDSEAARDRWGEPTSVIDEGLPTEQWIYY